MRLVDGSPFGILRSAARDGGMDVVASHLESPPARGDLVVVPHGEEALVLRVAGSWPTGSFVEASDRGADYLAQLAREPAAVPERVRELLLRFRVEVHPLGWYRRNGRFEAGIRATQLFGSPVFRPSPELRERLVNAGLGDEDPRQVVRLGRLARGHEVTDTEIRFSIRRLKGRRTVIFARAGYGKSNLTKLLLSRLYAAPPDVGLLIVDPEGEYAFSQVAENGERIEGLAEHPLVRERVCVYTDRRGQDRARVAGPLRLDLRRVRPGQFLTAFVNPEKLDQVWANWVRGCTETRWVQLVNLLHAEGYRATDEALAQVLGVRVSRKRDGGGDPSLQAVRNNLIPVLRLHDPNSTLLQGVVDQLGGHGRPLGVVILDVSTLPARDADAVTRLLLQVLFRRAVEAFTEGTRPPGVLLVVEEAQAVFGGRQLDDQDIYVRWVKEGRKYGLGAMLVTQQPGAIAPELVSQADHFFVMHLLARRDLDVLGAANAHFTPEVLGFIRDEPVRGNCWFWTAPDQPYAVEVRVDSYQEPRREPTPPPRRRPRRRPMRSGSARPSPARWWRSGGCTPTRSRPWTSDRRPASSPRPRATSPGGSRGRPPSSWSALETGTNVSAARRCGRRRWPGPWRRAWGRARAGPPPRWRARSAPWSCSTGRRWRRSPGARSRCARRCRSAAGEPYQVPTLGIDTHGSAGGRAGPFWRSSMEMRSGERTKAMRPSRGGRAMVTPSAWRWAQVA